MIKDENIRNLEWTDFEYTHKQKNADWFWYIASGALLITVIAILLRNFLFAILVITATFAIVLLSIKKPRELKFSINTLGVKAGADFYSYKEINSFWINYNPPTKKELIIKPKKKISQHIKIPLGNIDPNTAREFLIKILPEKEHEETLTETIIERLGF